MDKVTVNLRELLEDSLAAEIKRLKDEIEMWKANCEAERQAHEATIKQFNETYSGYHGHD